MIKIYEEYKKKLNETDIFKLLKLLQNKKPDFLREEERRRIWSIKYNNINIFVKNFYYFNSFKKFIKRYGLKNYKFSKLFIKNNIKTPLPIFYFADKKEEYFATLKIDNCINLWDFLSDEKNKGFKEDIVDKIRKLLEKFRENNVYHSDFNVKNLILDEISKELYILDLESVRLNLNKRRFEKMKSKINKYIKNFNIEV